MRFNSELYFIGVLTVSVCLLKKHSMKCNDELNNDSSNDTDNDDVKLYWQSFTVIVASTLNAKPTIVQHITGSSH